MKNVALQKVNHKCNTTVNAEAGNISCYSMLACCFRRKEKAGILSRFEKIN